MSRRARPKGGVGLSLLRRRKYRHNQLPSEFPGFHCRLGLCRKGFPGGRKGFPGVVKDFLGVVNDFLGVVNDFLGVWEQLSELGILGVLASWSFRA